MAIGVDDFQSRVFYTKDWSVEVENRFVKGLLRERIAGNYNEGFVNNGIAIRRIVTEINFCFNKMLDYKFCYNQTRRLRQRHEAFTRIIGHAGVAYNEDDNTMHCDPCIWDEIIKTERLALAYRVHGESHYASMQRIFEVEEDSAGFNHLQPITQLSSSMNSMSIMPSTIPTIEESPHSNVWKGIAGYESSDSDAGTPF